MKSCESYNKTDKHSIEKHAKKLVGESIRPYLPAKIIAAQEKLANHGKGNLGLLIEKYLFGIEPNNRPEPDFPEAGVELKTAGVVKKSGRYVPKEPRLSLSMINYDTICDETWENCSLLKKSGLLLLMFYLYETDKLPVDFIFKIASLWSF